MMRNEPPSLATWLLEHLLPGHQDEALAGDLLEDFHAGRSQGWYWRQVFAACATGWLRYFRDRRLIVIFAVVWSMLAPVWTALQDRILHGPGQTWRMDLSFTGLSGVVTWLLVNLSFVWAGAVLYFVSHPAFRPLWSHTAPSKIADHAFRIWPWRFSHSIRRNRTRLRAGRIQREAVLRLCCSCRPSQFSARSFLAMSA